MLNTTEYLATKSDLLRAAKAYYADGTSDLSDAEYDEIEAEVIAFETEHPDLVDGVPVAEAVAGGAQVAGTVRHSVPMLSLEKVTDDAEALGNWLRSTGLNSPDLVVIEPKLDGSSMSIRYVDGRPVQMLTRGDGVLGEDRTSALADLTNLPAKAGDFTGEVRGEVLFTRAQFAQANDIRTANDKTPFINARNGAAGALSGAATRTYRLPMSFYVYDAVLTEPAATHRENLDLLRGLGFELAYDILGATSVKETVARLCQRAERDALDVETDGIVLKANRAADRERLGLRSKSPRWALAYKFGVDLSDLPTTKLEAVEWAVGRTGVIAPRARIAPVMVFGTTVTYATLHNPDDIARRGFMLGDTVYVKRAGEVIPRLEAVKLDDRDGSQTPIDMPQVCPNCGSDIDRSQARWRCVRGVDCARTALLAYAVSRDVLDVDGLSTSLVSALVAEHDLADLADLFSLDAKQIAATPTGRETQAGEPVLIGETTGTKIAKGLLAAREADLGRVITALGIPGTGRSMSRRLAAHFGSMRALLAATGRDLMGVDKIGESKAQDIAAHLGRDDVRRMIDRLSDLGVTMEVPADDEDGDESSKPLAGMAVCVTGTMTGALAGKSRTEVQELIESLGARAASSVSKSTSMLLAGEKAGSKVAKAESLGVRVITEAEFAAEFLGA